ncbi:Protein of unknown function, partial [Gryllus bimaculatus]
MDAIVTTLIVLRTARTRTAKTWSFPGQPPAESKMAASGRDHEVEAATTSRERPSQRTSTAIPPRRSFDPLERARTARGEKTRGLTTPPPCRRAAPSANSRLFAQRPFEGSSGDPYRAL